jgi:hypothetical protein
MPNTAAAPMAYKVTFCVFIVKGRKSEERKDNRQLKMNQIFS